MSLALPMFSSFMKSIFKNKKGFTLLEVMVSAAVLTVGVGTMMVLVSNSLHALNVAKNRTIAVNLAQEGIEIVRNIRDTNWVQNLPYDNGFSAGSYCLDYQDADAASLVPCVDPVLYRDSTTGAYSHNPSGGVATNFYRTINITMEPNPEDDTTVTPDPLVIRVVSTVSWEQGNRQVSAEEHLYDWR